MSYYSSDADLPGRPIRRSRTGQQRPSHTKSFGHRATVPRMWSQDSNSRNMVPPNHQAPHYMPRVVDERRRRPSHRSRVTIEPSNRENDSDSGTDSDRGERRRRRMSIAEINIELADDRANDTPTSTIYSFTLSHISHTTPTQERSASGAEEPSEKEDHGVRNSAGAGGGIGPLQSYIFESNYSGNNLLGGSHGAKLTAVVSSHLNHAPLFRWRHCTRNFMDFDEFSTEAIGCPDLTAVEKKGIHDLLSRVQRRHVKSLQTSAGRTVRHMEPTSIQQPLPQDGPAKTASFARRMVTWVCLPYFTLEKYSGLQGAPNNRSAFPIETLLQSKFSRTARERDMRQAICQMNETPDGLCFHVAQIWCLVVDNSFLFTYGRMTEETLRGDIIDMSVKSVQEISKTHSQSFIAVSFKTSVMWSIPVGECHTWLDFMSHFREFWPQRLLFFHQKRPVKSDCWPRILNMARHVSDRIMLEMQIGASAKPPPVGILLLKQENATGPSLGPAGSEAASGSSHVTPGTSTLTSTDDHRVAPVTMSIFSCLMGVSRPEYGSVDQGALDKHMRKVEDFLLSNTSFSDYRAYKDCPEASRDEIYDYLKNEGADIVDLESQDRERQHAYETQIDLFNAADKAFAFFFPLDVDVPTIKKFWGAMKSIILGVNGGAATRQPMQGVIASDSIRSIRLELRGLCVGIGAFNDIFMLSGRSEQARITVPKKIVEGWIHLLLGLMNLPTDFDRSNQFIDNAKSLINGGMTVVVHGLSEKPLLDSSVVLPLELLSLMGLRMIQDTTVGMPNITECYSLSLDGMESDIASKALDRSREHRIGLLMEEITAVQRVVDAQQKIFKTLLPSSNHTINRDQSIIVDAMPTRFSSRQTYQREESSRPRDPFTNYRDDIPSVPFIVTGMSMDFRLSSVDAGGYRILFLNECLQFIAGRANDMAGFRDWAAFLEKKNQNKIDTIKDRHDNAIYAFTIVTIIFLPLSFVASVFGMNTNDVRNMDLDQWAYWATAVPVTAVIIFLGLLWTGELGNIMRWIQSLGQSHSGYRTLPDDAAREEIMYLSPYRRDEGRRR